MGYTLGIDIGIASIGFAGVEAGSSVTLFAGAHIFDAAENPKDGASLALPRREKRGLRRVIRRRAKRKKALRRLLVERGFQESDAIDATRRGLSSNPTGNQKTPWDYREEGLVSRLNDGAFCRVLFHIAKRRGFQSNRKGAIPNDTEGKKALGGAIALQEAMVQAGARTIGAYLATLPKKRNGDGNYEHFVMRDLLRHEVECLFEAQRNLGNPMADKAFQTAYETLAFSQRPLQSSEGLVGFCSLEPAERRAPRFAYSSELFVLWSRLNNLRVKTIAGDERSLTLDEKNRLARRAHVLKSLSYVQARKELGLSDDERFNIGYRKTRDQDNSWEKVRETAEKAECLKLTGYHVLKDILGVNAETWALWTGTDRDKLDEIARILSFISDEKEIDRRLESLVADPTQRAALVRITGFGKTVDLSSKALRRLLPFMQKGFAYDKACLAAGYTFGRKESAGLCQLPPFGDVRNPVVNRALAQARKVINAIIRRAGMPDTIVVELARDVGRAFKDRHAIERLQQANAARKEETRRHVEDEILEGRPANGDDILKYRLWKEQGAMCCYCGVEITPATLRDPLGVQIDHILPYSRSWDDGVVNKVVCHTGCNQEKGNRTPYEWLGATERWEGVQALARHLPPRKAERLLTASFDDTKEAAWKERNLVDTRFMARLLKNHIEQNLALGAGNRVQTRNGALTAHLRAAWGFPEKKRDNDRHHALDAIVLACSTQSMVQRLTQWNKYKARAQHPSERPLPPTPWATFRDDALTAVYGPKNPTTHEREGGITVSRMPCRKVTGAAHEETIRSIRTTALGERQIVQRVKLVNLSPANLEKLVDKERNIRLYNVLKDRLEAFDGKPDKAFAEPIFMPVNDPRKQGPAIHSVRIVTSEKSGVEVQGGLASNGDMVRVDVFLRGKKYLLVPVYVHHFVGAKLPDKAIVQGKDERDWEPVDDDAFLFSLYKNDYVRLVSKKETIEGYYVGTHRGTGAISVRAHDSSPSFGKKGIKEGLGVKTLLSLEKYSVDYFGHLTRIDKEPRLGLACSSGSKSGESDD
jgi:CRISPR-associated endonuclease Csn1